MADNSNDTKKKKKPGSGTTNPAPKKAPSKPSPGMLGTGKASDAAKSFINHHKLLHDL